MSASTPAFSQPTSAELLSQCFAGYPSQRLQKDYENLYSLNSGQLYLQSELVQWLDEHHWPQAYAAWQLAASCNAPALKSPTLCANSAQDYAPAPYCANQQASLSYLTLHRYLLQSIRSSWPELDAFFKGWAKFPLREDFPEPLQNDFVAWSDEVLASAKLADSIPKMPQRELLERWPTEADFAHWLLCGSQQPGIGADGVYGALMTNGFAMDSPAAPGDLENVQYYLFWQAQGWIERVWNKYRMRMGEMPQDSALQANVLRQCETFQYWVTQAARNTIFSSPKASGHSALFSDGQLNIRRAGETVRLLGEVLAIEPRGGNGNPPAMKNKNSLAAQRAKHWLQLDLKRVGVNPVWVYSPVPLVDQRLEIGRQFVVIGQVESLQRLHSSQLPAALDEKDSRTLLVLQSIQSPK